VLPSAETAAMLFWAEVVRRFRRAAGSVEGPPEGLLASGQITMRKVDGWQTLPEKLIPPRIDLAA